MRIMRHLSCRKNVAFRSQKLHVCALSTQRSGRTATQESTTLGTSFILGADPNCDSLAECWRSSGALAHHNLNQWFVSQRPRSEFERATVPEEHSHPPSGESGTGSLETATQRPEPTPLRDLSPKESWSSARAPCDGQLQQALPVSSETWFPQAVL